MQIYVRKKPVNIQIELNRKIKLLTERFVKLSQNFCLLIKFSIGFPEYLSSIIIHFKTLFRYLLLLFFLINLVE